MVLVLRPELDGEGEPVIVEDAESADAVADKLLVDEDAETPIESDVGGAADELGTIAPGIVPRTCLATATSAQPTSTPLVVFMGRAKHAVLAMGQGMMSKPSAPAQVANPPATHAVWPSLQADCSVRVAKMALKPRASCRFCWYTSGDTVAVAAGVVLMIVGISATGVPVTEGRSDEEVEEEEEEKEPEWLDVADPLDDDRPLEVVAVSPLEVVAVNALEIVGANPLDVVAPNPLEVVAANPPEADNPLEVDEPLEFAEPVEIVDPLEVADPLEIALEVVKPVTVRDSEPNPVVVVEELLAVERV